VALAGLVELKASPPPNSPTPMLVQNTDEGQAMLNNVRLR
jgi:hypothetical protein